MKYKSQSSSISILLIFVIVFVATSFIEIPVSLKVPVLVGMATILGIFVLLASLQDYEITSEAIIIRHVTTRKVFFHSIRKAILLKQQSNIRVRYNRNPIQNIKDAAKIASRSFQSSKNYSSLNAQDLHYSLNSLNERTTLAKLKLLEITAVILSTDEGEIRILPKNPEQFIIELYQNYKNSERKNLVIDTSLLKI